MYKEDVSKQVAGRHLQRATRHGRTLHGSRVFPTALVALISPFLFGATLARPALAQELLPSGGTVTAGTADISGAAGGHLQIDQSSSHAIINWSSFSIGSGNRVNIANGNGATLNRVTGSSTSSINGMLSSSGSVYLINRNGVIIGKEGVIDVGGSFIASTLGIRDADFMDGGETTFSGSSDALVVNYGKIGALGGDVALIAAQVENNGSIDAPNGTAALISGYEVLMRDAALDDGKFVVKVGGSDTSATNNGAIRAAEAELRANGGNVLALAGNTKGVIRATGVKKQGGRVFLTAGGGSVSNKGRIVARKAKPRKIAKADTTRIQPATNGGEVYIRAKYVHQAGSIDLSGQTGGLAVLTGNHIDLTSGSLIDVSGSSGGAIRIGGDYQGGITPDRNLFDTPLATAKRVTVEKGATLRADASHGNGGSVVVWSDVQTSFAGLITARGGADAGNGGWAEVSSKGTLAYKGFADLTATSGITGTLLLDPTNYTINQTGISPDGGSAISVAALLSQLASASVNIQTAADGPQNGDITVSDALAWASSNTLTLTAAGGVTITAAITAAAGGLTIDAVGTATPSAPIHVGKFTLTNGNWVQNAAVLPDFQATDFTLAGGSFLRASGGDGTSAAPFGINDVFGLQGIGSSTTLLGADYKLTANINASGTSGWNGGAGFVPIGNSTSNSFSGSFDGDGHTITNLAIVRPLTSDVGLFGNIQGGTIGNVGIIDGTIRGGNDVGGLAGVIVDGTISHAYTTGTASGGINVGGLVGFARRTMISDSYSTSRIKGTGVGIGGLTGQLNGSTVTHSYASGDVNGLDQVGGLIGQDLGDNMIAHVHASGAVRGVKKIGGLIGDIGANSRVENAYATGAVSGINRVGGLVGITSSGSTISQSYAAGPVNGTTQVGGLVGANFSGIISQAYATGNVSGTSEVGGLVGVGSGGTIDQSYATGAVSGVSNVGGLFGQNSSTISSASFWDRDTTGQTVAVGSGDAAGTHGLRSDNSNGAIDAFGQATFTGQGWDFSTDWTMVDGETRPFGQWEHSTTISNAHQLQLVGMNAATLAMDYTIINDIDLGAALSDPSQMWKTAASGVQQYGFVPIGDATNYFTGDLNGGGHVISGLFINRPATDNVGLVGASLGSYVSDLGLADVEIFGHDNVGALAGFQGSGPSGATRVYSGGNVNGNDNVGGLIGHSLYGNGVTYTYSDANVSGNGSVGGLMGRADFMRLNHAYATGTVSGSDNVGGLAGTLLGSNMQYVYASGAVNGATNTGGLVGSLEHTSRLSNNHWDINTTGQNSAYGSISTNAIVNTTIGLTTAQARNAANYAGWSIATAPGNSVPATGWLMIDGETRPFLAFEHSTDIRNLHQLQLMGFDLDANYVVIADIDASASSGASASDMWATSGFVPIGDATNYFTGDLDGGGHVISGLFINRPSTDNVGLVGASLGSHVSDLGVADVTIIGRDNVGALAGYQSAKEGGASRVYSSGYVNGNDNVGGLIGQSHYGRGVAYAYSDANVSGNSSVGGLIGRTRYNELNQAYATGTVSGKDSVGGLVGTLHGTRMNYVYASGSVNGVTNTGGLVGSVESISQLSNSRWDINTTGQNSAYGSISTNAIVNTTIGLTTAQARNAANYAGWSISAAPGNSVPATDWLMIDGETRPFLAFEHTTQISNLHQLQLMGFDLDANYRLIADIDASATSGANASDMWTTSGFVPIGTSTSNSFSGSFDGAGHTISNLAINRPLAIYVGLFGNIQGGAISDVGIIDGTIRGASEVGGLAGVIYDGTISNAYTTGTASGGRTVGGLVGFARRTTISDSYSASRINGTGEIIGGLVGQLHSSAVMHSYASGDVNGVEDVGGLIGLDNSFNVITHVHASGTVSGVQDIGGLIGTIGTDTRVENAYATGAVSGINRVGGLVGANFSGLISQAYATGNVSGTSEVGGLVGEGSGATIAQSYATGAVDGDQLVGGLVGKQWNSTTTGSHAIGSVAGSSQVGGLVGGNYGGILTRVYSVGQVNGGREAGGLVGENSNGTITQAYATGAVIGAVRIGGLVGYNHANSTITQAYASGFVRALSNSGGLIGENSDSTVAQVYATGAVSDGANTGGLVGLNIGNSSFTASYWNTETTGQAGGYGENTGAIITLGGLTTAQLQAALPNGFDSSDWGVIADISNPYFNWRFASGPRVVSGQVSGVTDGNGALGVNVAVDGTLVAATHTGADGTYYLALDTLGTPVLAWLDGTRYTIADSPEYGNAVASTGGGHATGLDIDKDWVRVNSTHGTLSSVQDGLMTDAMGALSGNEFLYSVSATPPSLNPAIGLRIHADHSNFVVDRALDNNGPVWMESTGHLTLASGTSIVTSAPGTGIVLSAVGDFVNNAGANALMTAGRWLVYSNNPQGASFGGLDSNNTAKWNSSIMMTVPDSVIETGNRYLFKHQPILTVRSKDASKIYGQVADLSSVFEITGYMGGVAGAFLADDPSSVVNGAPLLSSAGAHAAANVGGGTGSGSGYVIVGEVGSLTSRAGHAFSFADDGLLTVNKATLSIAADNQSKTFDDNVFVGPYTASYSGFVNGDSAANLDGQLTFGGASQGAINVGMHEITVDGHISDNYDLIYVGGVLTINQQQHQTGRPLGDAGTGGLLPPYDILNNTWIMLQNGNDICMNDRQSDCIDTTSLSCKQPIETAKLCLNQSNAESDNGETANYGNN